MKNTKVILSAVMLAALVSCTSNQSAKQQREFCEQSKLFDNICHDGDHVSSEAKANDKGPSGQPDKETPQNNNNHGSSDNNNNGNNNNNNDKKDTDKGLDCNCNYGGSYDE